MKRPLRMVLAGILIIAVCIVWMVLTVLVGWKYGGGMIPRLSFLALAVFVWITITKKIPEEKVVAKTAIAILGFFGVVTLCFLVSAFITTPAINAQFKTFAKNNSTQKETTLPLPHSPLPEYWERISIDSVGTIDIPPTLEVQSGDYKKRADSLRGIVSDPSYNIVFQQKGLNVLENSALQRYARVILSTDIGKKGDFDKLDFNIGDYSTTDISKLDKLFRSEQISKMAGTKDKLIDWFPLKLENINGMSCIHISYTRQLNDNPVVFVDIYSFQNVDKMYTLSLSYRQKEADYWSDDFKTMLRSFRIGTAMTQFGTLTDKRDGKTYKTTVIGGKMWMAQNLNYLPQSGNSWCYDNDNSYCNKYGRLYDWNTAKEVCPVGWHLPNSQEWDILAMNVGGKRERYKDGDVDLFYWDGAGKTLKSRSGWNSEHGKSGNGTDTYGFSALPSGYRQNNGNFYDVGNIGNWWADKEDNRGYAYRRGMLYNGDIVLDGFCVKAGGCSVRCVAD